MFLHPKNFYCFYTNPVINLPINDIASNSPLEEILSIKVSIKNPTLKIINPTDINVRNLFIY